MVVWLVPSGGANPGQWHASGSLAVVSQEGLVGRGVMWHIGLDGREKEKEGERERNWHHSGLVSGGEADLRAGGKGGDMAYRARWQLACGVGWTWGNSRLVAF